MKDHGSAVAGDSMATSGLLRLREPSVAQCSRSYFRLSLVKFRTLAAQVPGEDSDAQNQDQQ